MLDIFSQGKVPLDLATAITHFNKLTSKCAQITYNCLVG